MADRYWVLGTGTWDASATTHWASSSGGAPGASAPTASDNVIFDANSNVTTTAFTVTTNAGVCLDFLASGLDGLMTLSGAATGVGITVFGSWSSPSSNFATAIGGSESITFAATSGTRTIATNGVSFLYRFTFNGIGGTWQLSGNTTCGLITLTNGALDLNSFTLTSTAFSSNNSNTRSIAFGTGKLILTAGNTTSWNCTTISNLTLSGTPVADFTYSGSTGSRIMSHGDTAGGTEARAMSFNITGGTDQLNLTGFFKNLIQTGFTGSMSEAAKTIYGDWTINAGTTITAFGSTTTFASTSGVQTFTSGGVNIGNQNLTLNGIGGTLKFGDTITGNAARTFTLTNGTLDFNGQTLSLGAFVTATGTKSITWNGGTLIVAFPASTGTPFNNNAPTNFSTSAGSGAGTISLTAATAKTFTGAGSTFNAKLRQGGVGTLTVTGANTFTDIDQTAGAASTISFTAGTTTTFTTGFSLSGTAGYQVTLGSVTAASHTLSKSSGTVNVSYLNISRSTATGGATWNSPTSNGNVDNGNNSGWNFAAVVASTINFLMFF